MDTVTATFSIPEWIEQGLKSQTYERVGGVIRDSQTKHIVAMLREAAPNLTQASTILSQFGSAASILNLGVSVIGFALVINRLEEIEQRLKLVEKDLKQLNRKFDISVYANFRAALDLAHDAFTMTKPENRVNMANLAIEAMIETHRRFEAYQAEIQAMAQLKISFHEWLKLTPSDAKPDSAELMYIIPSKPLEL
jgi:PAS domain-containing protein